MPSRPVILGLAVAIVATPLPAAAQSCYLHVQNTYDYRVVVGARAQCWLRTYITTGTTAPPAGFQHVGAAGTRSGPGCVPFMASMTANWAGQQNWICFRQTFNGAVQLSKPPGAW